MDYLFLFLPLFATTTSCRWMWSIWYGYVDEDGLWCECCADSVSTYATRIVAWIFLQRVCRNFPYSVSDAPESSRIVDARVYPEGGH